MTTVIETFYNAFSNLDSESMVNCYHDDIVFKDPAFGVLKGPRAKNMWRMLCESQKNKDFQVTYSNIKAAEHEGSASWEAIYTFSKTGRKVHNTIEAHFEFKDGKIVKHTDSFNLHRWSKQALGLKGAIIGRTKYFRNKLKTQTNRLLDNFEKNKANSN
ncbi:nuclear transport factor 2 family protein [Psychroserpens sp.]|uniref:nuclear transport factor 2 family protein n=1 Tax=Psychroserpens sp. TaxID=2020870 RepID=UPI002B267DA8|nr:nuclear transport factor 2 family protein [Psychroserpens sp.]